MFVGNRKRIDVAISNPCFNASPLIGGKFRPPAMRVVCLLRKPGAFNDYKYPDDLFPRSHFRVAYDTITKQWPGRADKEYLKLLELAALDSEVAVESAIKNMLAKGLTPTVEGVEHILNQDSHTSNVPEIAVCTVDLKEYDSLLENKEVC